MYSVIYCYRNQINKYCENMIKQNKKNIPTRKQVKDCDEEVSSTNRLKQKKQVGDKSRLR